jgi:hypothetical protein
VIIPLRALHVAFFTASNQNELGVPTGAKSITGREPHTLAGRKARAIALPPEDYPGDDNCAIVWSGFDEMTRWGADALQNEIGNLPGDLVNGPLRAIVAGRTSHGARSVLPYEGGHDIARGRANEAHCDLLWRVRTDIDILGG